MSIAIDMPPAYVEQAEAVARQRGMTLSELFMWYVDNSERHEPPKPNVVDRLAGIAGNLPADFDDHGVLARAMLEKYERISQ